jgi:hypothetical protein
VGVRHLMKEPGLSEEVVENEEGKKKCEPHKFLE